MIELLQLEDIQLGPFTDETAGRLGEIRGVQVKKLVEHVDNRGRVFEFFPNQQDFWSEEIVWGHCFTVNPGAIKGWGVHLGKVDRYCLISGEALTVLFDSRVKSSSFGTIQEIHLSEGGNRMVFIPNGVWHLNVNLGEKEAMFIDLPTATYNHQEPDKITVPWNTNKIPFNLGYSTWVRATHLKNIFQP